MICAVISGKTAEQARRILKQVEMAEIRLDLCDFSDEEIEEIFSEDTPTVATCRAEDGNWREAERQLTLAVRAGAHYADLEIEAPSGVSKRMAQACAEYGTILIRSHHDFAGTPSLDELKAIADRMRHYGGEVIKVVTTAHCEEDVRRVFDLYRYYTPASLIAFALPGNAANANPIASALPNNDNGNDIAALPGDAADALLDSEHPSITSDTPLSNEVNCAPCENADAASLSATTASLTALCTQSRLDSLKAGAPFCYGVAPGCDAVVSGQPDYGQLRQAVYGGFSEWNLSPLRLPSSKSCAQRAVLAAALANGTSTISGYSGCDDSDAALALAAKLGAKINETQAPDGSVTLSIEGIGATENCLSSAALSCGQRCQAASGTISPGQQQQHTASATLSLGQSGLLARLMMPLGCELFDGGVTLTGEGTLATRVLEGADKVIEALGGKVTQSAPQSSQQQGIQNPPSQPALQPILPLTVEGPLRPGRIKVDGSHSSQIISGAIMALPLCGRNSTLHVNRPASIPYIYMTMDILRKFGVKVRSEMYGGRELLDEQWDKCTDIVLKIRENQRYKSTDIELEADWSAAAPLMVAGAVFGSVRLQGLDTTSLQADLSILDILLDAGAVVSQNDAPKGEILCRRAPLQPIDEDLTNCPDLFPCVAILCAFCQGRSNLDGVHRLVHKESNRALAILQMLKGLGVRAEIRDDRMTIEGESLESRLMNGRMLKGGQFSSFGDHRMVMALKVASLGTAGTIESHAVGTIKNRTAEPIKSRTAEAIVIDDVGCVSKSWPQFNDIFMFRTKP